MYMNDINVKDVSIKLNISISNDVFSSMCKNFRCRFNTNRQSKTESHKKYTCQDFKLPFCTSNNSTLLLKKGKVKLAKAEPRCGTL